MTFHCKEIDRATLFLQKQFERGKSVKIEVIKQVKTLSQNSYAWLVFTHVADETGNTKEDIYQYCLKKFPTFKSIELNGVIELIPVTLSGMDKEQASFFIDQFTIHFRSEGIDVPDPEDQKAKEMFEYYRMKGIL